MVHHASCRQAQDHPPPIQEEGHGDARRRVAATESSGPKRPRPRVEHTVNQETWLRSTIATCQGIHTRCRGGTGARWRWVRERWVLGCWEACGGGCGCCRPASHGQVAYRATVLPRTSSRKNTQHRPVGGRGGSTPFTATTTKSSIDDLQRSGGAVTGRCPPPASHRRLWLVCPIPAPDSSALVSAARKDCALKVHRRGARLRSAILPTASRRHGDRTSHRPLLACSCSRTLRVSAAS